MERWLVRLLDDLILVNMLQCRGDVRDYRTHELMPARQLVTNLEAAARDLDDAQHIRLAFAHGVTQLPGAAFQRVLNMLFTTGDETAAQRIYHTSATALLILLDQRLAAREKKPASA